LLGCSKVPQPAADNNGSLASFFLNFESKDKFEIFPPKSSLLPRFLMTAANNYRLILCKPPPLLLMFLIPAATMTKEVRPAA